MNYCDALLRDDEGNINEDDSKLDDEFQEINKEFIEAHLILEELKQKG